MSKDNSESNNDSESDDDLSTAIKIKIPQQLNNKNNKNNKNDKNDKKKKDDKNNKDMKNKKVKEDENKINIPIPNIQFNEDDNILRKRYHIKDYDADQKKKTIFKKR